MNEKPQSFEEILRSRKPRPTKIMLILDFDEADSLWVCMYDWLHIKYKRDKAIVYKIFERLEKQTSPNSDPNRDRWYRNQEWFRRIMRSIKAKEKEI